MHVALSPLMKALVANDLLRHSDLDVKVAVASCISEITRITAPDAPYNDDKMKDVFQLIVSSFENLHDQSSRSYNKRVLILETVAKVRLCVVMLDLECDKLITEMFQHFLKAIREDHPENIFSSMENIMTLVLEESEELPVELLSPLLASVKKDNDEVTPIAKRLGEKVFANCAEKLKPYLMQAVESLHISLDEYDSKTVTLVCEGTLQLRGHKSTSYVWSYYERIEEGDDGWWKVRCSHCRLVLHYNARRIGTKCLMKYVERCLERNSMEPIRIE
uniref:Sister chromatid cohesion protein PDS5 homolog B-B-like n=1 Tax=Nicotiana tabacum TaxID=4097 RepID=A0A1S3YK33_TOBAC|nr:PREDICTED: sister chromatid cohesion protein PDS5 homolog B-B-like [Nicotiana tabacum]